MIIQSDFPALFPNNFFFPGPSFRDAPGIFQYGAFCVLSHVFMKKIFFLILAIMAVSCKQDPRQAVLDNIMTRTSVRAYTAEPVSDTDVQILLKAAMAAPSAKNRQPWEFIVVNERQILDSLAGKLRYAKMLAEVPLAIVICAHTFQEGPDGALKPNGYWEHDASAACENLLLAAHALGLGAVWTAASDEERSAIVREVLRLRAGISPLCVVPIGHPAENPVPKDKWKPEKIHYNRW